MKHAEKLTLKINYQDLDFTKCTTHKEYTKIQRFSLGLTGTAFGSETKHVPDSEYFLQQLPKTILDIEIPYVFLLDIKTPDCTQAVLPAHIDINKLCGINVYIQAQGEVTKFYDWNSVSRSSTYVEEFCATQGETWLMNNQQPHSVDLIKNCQRRILTYSFIKTPYNQILEILKCKNYPQKQEN